MAEQPPARTGEESFSQPKVRALTPRLVAVGITAGALAAILTTILQLSLAALIFSGPSPPRWPAASASRSGARASPHQRARAPEPALCAARLPPGDWRRLDRDP